MIIFLKKYKSKIALMVFICVLVCTVSCLLDFKTIEKQKMPGLEKKSVFMAAENTVAKNTDKAVNEPRLHAVSAALYDADDETFIYGKNMRDSMANASTTKILTCIVALEKADINDTVTISQNAASQPEVKLGLVAGNSYNMKDLLYGMMLESFNDCAYAIAEHVGGSTEGFAKLMNEKANEIGCLGTYFITPNGLDAENDISFHHSTAGDLCVIMSYCAWKSPKSTQFLEITQTMQYTFETKEGQMVFSNHNRLLTETDYCISGKTGFTTKAGYCYVAAVEKDGRRMCLSLLGCGWPNNKNYKWADAKSLVEYAVSDAAEDSYCDAACVTTQQTGDTRNTINLKYIENNKKNKISKMKNIVIFGAPGSGKGTQSDKIVAKYGFKHISTGDVLRNEIKNGTELGKTADSYIKDGKLLPDSLMTDILASVFDKMLPCDGVIFDGFPRTVAQAEALDKMLAKRNTEVKAMIELSVPDEELMKRLIMRGKVSGRSDDNEKTISKRLDVYKSQTSPLIDWYNNCNKHYHIEGVGSVDDIFAKISEVIDKL